MIIVTGVSRGFGKAIAEYFLAKGDPVLGIGRTCTIEHTNFSFIPCDLSDLQAVKELSFQELEGNVTLVNNAGILGNINRLAELEDSDIDRVLTVNVSAVAVLTQKVYQAVVHKDNFTLVNISSGAAKRAIPSWSSYCASKAALNMLTETFFEEEKEKGNHPRVLIVAPGVIDTGMQETIRSASPECFSSHHRFVSLKENNELFSPAEAAKRLGQLLESNFSDDLHVDLRAVNAE